MLFYGFGIDLIGVVGNKEIICVEKLVWSGFMSFDGDVLVV